MYSNSSSGFLFEDGRLKPHMAAAGFPLDPIWYSTISIAHGLGSSKTLTFIAALSTLQHSIFHRRHRQHQAFEIVKAGFRHPLSDHFTELNALRAYQNVVEENILDVDDWCYRMFLSRRMVEMALAAQEQIELFMARALGGPLRSLATLHPLFDVNFRKSLARGLHTKAALLIDRFDAVYQPLYYTPKVLADASSIMWGMPAKWVVFNSIRLGDKGVEFAVTMTAIEPEWILDMPLFRSDALADRVAHGLMERRFQEIIKGVQARIAGGDKAEMEVD
jgi:hypothetical protein